MSTPVWDELKKLSDAELIGRYDKLSGNTTDTRDFYRAKRFPVEIAKA